MDRKLSKIKLLLMAGAVASTSLAANATPIINPVIAAALETQGTTVANTPLQQRVSALAAGPDTGTNSLIELALSRVEVKEEVNAETTELFGEQIDLNTGAISLTNTDVSIPGNFPIDVGVSRVYRGTQYSQGQLLQFADWQLDIPAITTTVADGTPLLNTWTNGKPCSGSLNPGSVDYMGYGYVTAQQYWGGDFISVPGVGTERLLEPTTTGTGTTRVAKNWRITCQANGASEAFIATSPQGIRYTFSVLRMVQAEDIQLSVNDKETGSTWTFPVGRFQAFMQVSKIEDRFGNYVNYNFSSPDQLDSISSSDGRSIQFVYEMGVERKRIKSITANGKTWQYFYRTSTAQKWINGIYVNPDQLSRVVLPDGREWNYDIDFAPKEVLKQRHIVYSFGETQQDDNQCSFSSTGAAITPQIYVSRVTHPNGLRAEFAVQPTIFGRSKVPKQLHSSTNRINLYERCFSNYALVRKTLEGKGVGTLNWHYSYSQNPGQYTDNSGDFGPAPQGLTGIANIPTGLTAMDLRSTTVVAPDGSKTLHVFNRSYTYGQDKEVLTYQYDTNGSTLLQRTEHVFVAGNQVGKAQLFSQRFNGTALSSASSFDNEAQHNSFINKSESRIYRYLNGSVSESYTNQYSSYNSYGVPLITKELNSFNGKVRYTRDTYQHDLVNWVLNLPTNKELSTNGTSYTSVQSTSYYATTHASKSLPYQESAYGLLQSTNSYDSQGNLQLKNFNLSNRWIQFSSYKRGKPQLIKIPSRYTAPCTDPASCFQSINMSVNDDGTIAWVRDFNNNETSYGYDNVGRLTSINPADSRWADTSISYDLDYSGAAAVVQNITRGSYRKAVTLDGLLRPILTKEWDLYNESATTRYTRQEFNAYGKAVFSSVPSEYPYETFGSFTSYDGLQRVTQQTNTANGDMSFEYLAGNVVRSTNGRFYQTTTQYLAYGSPEQELAVSISQPESVTTTIVYNLFNNPTSISQGSVVENRIYDSYQRLCLQKRPETAIKALQYNNLGQVTKYAEGLAGNGSSSCTDYTNNANSWVTITYDNQGAESGKSFLDGSPAISNSLDPQGNLLTLTAGSTSWAYTYNSKHQVETEQLNIDGTSFALNPEYDSLGNLSSLTYNGQFTATYTPNALGHPTVLNDGTTMVASNVLYYPNGQLKSFNYGNGLRFSQSLDAEFRPYERAVLQSNTYRVAQRYGYDDNNNINALTDLVTSSRSVSMQYDGLDRLDVANGAWGSGSFDYDTLGNLTYKTVAGVGSSYSYNSSTNRLSTVTGGYSFSYDDRGNVTNNGKRAFGFNRANQLISSGTVTYAYDGYNRRIKQQTAAGVSYSLYNSAGQLMMRQNPSALRSFSLYLGNNLVAERDIGSSNTIRYQHTDALGSVIAESNTAGTITSSSAYQPFGERIGGQKTGLGFTGHLEDTDIGLTYMQARYYDPVIGRFYSNDPVGFSTSNPMMFNRYAYANNNPYKFVDPDGREPFNFQWISQVQNPSTAMFSQSQATQFNQTASNLGNSMAAVAPQNPAGVLLGSLGLATGVAASVTGVGTAPGAMVTLLSLDGIRSSWTGGRTLSGMGLEAVGDAFDLEDGSIKRLGNFGDFVQNTASGGAQSLHSAAKNVGNIGDAAGATSQIRDMANMAGGVQTYSVNGRIDSARLEKSLEKKE
ncbi:RHS repeat domain-containing protein [Rheinheimera sp.]|uniref:RHS repeat domain-containing protein n=1 Tax=Rheinheimera sp. TaxID=1869214 RepID=UPI003AF6B0A4